MKPGQHSLGCCGRLAVSLLVCLSVVDSRLHELGIASLLELLEGGERDLRRELVGRAVAQSGHEVLLIGEQRFQLGEVAPYLVRCDTSGICTRTLIHAGEVCGRTASAGGGSAQAACANAVLAAAAAAAWLSAVRRLLGAELSRSTELPSRSWSTKSVRESLNILRFERTSECSECVRERGKRI